MARAVLCSYHSQLLPEDIPGGLFPHGPTHICPGQKIARISFYWECIVNLLVGRWLTCWGGWEQTLKAPKRPSYLLRSGRQGPNLKVPQKKQLLWQLTPAHIWQGKTYNPLWKESVKVKVAQSCLTLCDSVDYSPPGSLSMEYSM